MADSETLEAPSSKKNVSSPGDDFPSMTMDLFKKVNLKTAIFIFLMGILVFSDVFIENVLESFDGASEAGEATTKGTMVQLTVITLGYLIVDLLIQGGCI